MVSFSFQDLGNKVSIFNKQVCDFTCWSWQATLNHLRPFSEGPFGVQNDND